MVKLDLRVRVDALDSIDRLRACMGLNHDPGAVNCLVAASLDAMQNHMMMLMFTYHL